MSETDTPSGTPSGLLRALDTHVENVFHDFYDPRF